MKFNKYIDHKIQGENGYQHSRSVNINSTNNGGEAIILSVDFFDYGNGKTEYRTSIDLQCYGSHTTSVYLGSLGENLRDALNKMLPRSH